MKNMILLAALAFSWHSWGHVEHRPGMGAAPSASRSRLAHQCFSEAVSSGCRSPKENRREFRLCVRDQIASLSQECQAFMAKKYGPVKN